MKKIHFAIAITILCATAYAQQNHPTPSSFHIDESHYIDTHYYKATQTQLELYSQAKFDIDWPIAPAGYDFSLLYQAIGQGKKLHDAASLVKDYESHYFPADKWMPINYKAESDGDIYETDNEDYLWYVPFGAYGSLKLKQLAFNGKRGYVIYLMSDYSCGGSGFGASCVEVDAAFTFDYRNNRLVTFSDVFQKSAKHKILALLRNPQMTEPAVEFMSQPERVPENFYVRDGICYFIFEKYEIGCGADGVVHLGLSLSHIKQYLTEYGRQLFM